jgi:hypothetical protein
VEEIKFTIKEANNEINRLTNLLNLYIDRKNLLFNDTQPKSADPNAERVDGSMTREEKFFKYVYKCENEQIDWWIEKINIYIIALNNYVEAELKRIGEYEPLKAKIIKLREEKGMKWDDIAEATHYCRRQCINIYKNYTGKRNVEDCTPIALLK